MKFKSKPEIVEAFQLVENSPLPPGTIRHGQGPVYAETVRGMVPMRPGDWLVTEETGVKRLYPADVFEQLYERIEDIR